MTAPKKPLIAALRRELKEAHREHEKAWKEFAWDSSRPSAYDRAAKAADACNVARLTLDAALKEKEGK